MKRTLFCCGLLLCSAGFAAAQVTEDPPARFLAARAEFEQGRAGVGGANQRAAEGFQALVEAHPGHPLFRVYLGSTYALKARDGWFPFTRLRNVETGLDHVSKALGLLRPEHDAQTPRGVPVGLETRLVAVATYLAVPGFFNRLQDGQDVLDEALALPTFAAAPPAVRAEFYLHAAEVQRRKERPAEELAYLRKALAESPDSPVGGKARARLQALEE
jgi:hypothetical protein